MEITMIGFLLFTLAATEAAYYSRMATMNRLRMPSVAFRPGVTLQRPWNHRLVAAASHRAPYVVVRSPPHRYAMKHFGPSNRNVFSAGPWKTTRHPGLAVTPEYEFVRAASAPPLVPNDGGAIHTIPAPNLSLSEKPIVVIEDNGNSNNAATEQPKTAYEVTEKYLEPLFQMAKIETPVGFSKPQQVQASPELQTYLRNGAALQLAADYGLSAISLPQNVAPQQFTVQGIQTFNAIPPQQEPQQSVQFNQAPNVIFQSDPMFLHKLQQQLLQRFPSVEFVPYAAEVPQNPPPNQENQQFFLLENEEIKQPQETFVPSESKNVVQRETPEGTLVTLVPQAIMVSNATEKPMSTEAPKPQNITLELVPAESQPVSTTIKYVIESTEAQTTQTTPIYYAQVGQSVGNVIANGFYSAINDVRAQAALEQVEKQETTKAAEAPTTTINPDLQQYFVQTNDTENKTVKELKPLLGVPFAKPAESVKVAYTLLRTDEKEPKMTKEGTVYAGQIVEASISEDHDFNKQKSTLMKRAPIRLFAVTEKKEVINPVTSAVPKVTVVKAKIPPKSKLTFDDKTGEPVLRIYASYVDNPAQKDQMIQKLTSLRPIAVTRKDMESWKTSTAKSVDKTQGFDGNQVTQFGLKLRSRSDDYIPLFEEYDE